jgi:hypothetical protein
MALNIDKNIVYVPIFLIVFIFLATLFVEVFGCKWTELLSSDFNSFFMPGIKVIG